MISPIFNYPFEQAGASDPGRVRSENQDRLVIDAVHGFFGVSDGMGGLRCGAEAATYVRESMPKLMSACAQEGTAGEAIDEKAERLRLLVRTLSDRLYRFGNAEGRFDYGATIVGVWLCEDRAIFVCLGDSRGYLLPKDETKLLQVTQDMNVAGLMERNGWLTHSQALHSPARSQLTAFVGMAEPAVPEISIRKIHPGDTILLCSDGLHGMVPEDEIASILRRENELDNACRALIEAANRYDGKDNISCVVIRVR